MDSRIEQSINYIEDNLHLSFNLKTLAKIACLSASQFHRVFKKETGKTPFQFVEKLKIEKAYDLVVHSNSTVHQIADQLGYRDYETFSRAFKRKYALSPHDLKAVVLKLHELINGNGSDQIIFTSIHSNDEHLMLERIREVLVELNISQNDLINSSIFQILKQPSINSNELVKKKFALKKDEELKKKLLK